MNALERVSRVAGHSLQRFTLELRPPGGKSSELSSLIAQFQRKAKQHGAQVIVEQVGADFRVSYDIEPPKAFELPGHDAAKENMRAMVARGELLSSSRFAEARGVTKQAVSKALGARRLFYIDVDGAQYFPAFYLDSTLERRQLEQVTKALGDLPGPSKLQFFLNGKGSLGNLTPLQALARGKYADVRATARGFVER
ncbi:MAG TPA: hypothetical protein PK177_08025 [Burkholderiaceae bacterium]|nr:hypothetical protein [Burkholderiaceae bacterium]